MSRMQTVLAATDLSLPARHAVMRAAMLASEAGARLALIHVVNLSLLESLRQFLGHSAVTVEQQLTDEAMHELDQLAVDIKQHYGVEADVHIATGAVLQELVSHADRLDADLLVMGVRGAGSVRELLLGSTTERVLRKSLRPLLVVKQAPHESYRRVLMPVDFSARSLSSLNIAHMAAPKADLILLNAFEAPFERKLRYAGVDDLELTELLAAAEREARARMNELVLRNGLPGDKVQGVVLHAEPTRCILEQGQERDCDLIAIGKHGYGMVEEWLLGSVTKHVLALSGCDLLVADRRVT